MKRVFIDAYNLIFSLELKEYSLEEKRQEIISLLEKLALKLHFHFILVFDGEKKLNRGLFQRSHIKNLEIIYTPPEMSADQYIAEALTAIKKNEHIFVITSDRFLSQESRRLGAESMTIKEFFTWISTQTRKKEKKSDKPIKETDAQIERYLKLFQRDLSK